MSGKMSARMSAFKPFCRGSGKMFFRFSPGLRSAHVLNVFEQRRVHPPEPNMQTTFTNLNGLLFGSGGRLCQCDPDPFEQEKR